MKNKLFHTSPQMIHISTTMRRMFSVMNEDERNIFASENCLNDDNLEVWSVLQVRRVPSHHSRQFETELNKRLKVYIEKLHSKHCTQVDCNYFVSILNCYYKGGVEIC